MNISEGRHLTPNTPTRNSFRKKWNRSLILLAVVFLVLTSAMVGFASVETSVGLAESDKNIDSSTLTPSDSNCPSNWRASNDYIVWKLVLDGDEDGLKVNEFAVEVAAGDNEAQVKDGAFYVKTHQHTSLVAASVAVKGYDQQGLSLRLDGVCYQGAGPVPDVTFVFQAVVCDSFAAINGNQVDGQSSWWDKTSGAWEAWAMVYTTNAPVVTKLSQPPGGCEWENGQQFSMGTSSSMANRWKVPGATAKHNHGHVEASSDELPDAIKQALVAEDGQVWFHRTDMGGVDFGAFKCHDDSLHADDVEFIHETPASGSQIVCISYAVDA